MKRHKSKHHQYRMFCDRCGGQMVRVGCEEVCTRCGYKLDCSDGGLAKPDEEREVVEPGRPVGAGRPPAA